MSTIKTYWLFSLLVFAATVKADTVPDNTQLSVWVNEAIVATYSYDYKNYLERQRAIAKYFTAEGWTAYSAALNNSKLPEAVKTNAYAVSAVATLPPEIKLISTNHWQAVMPILVVYKNPQYQQKQILNVSIHFESVPAGQGVRGLSISSLQAKISEPPCQCQPVETAPATINAQ